MRFHYFQFPEETPLSTLAEYECEAYLIGGKCSVPLHLLTDEERERIDHVDHVICVTYIRDVKKLIKKYGGSGWTYHCDRNGHVVETTPIVIEDNNSNRKNK